MLVAPSRLVWVYPRMYGGTVLMLGSFAVYLGLSPHARGNLPRSHHADAGDGSIPARAGEPSMSAIMPAPNRVYPRTRGGTLYEPLMSGTPLGLSPHARGNPQLPQSEILSLGSIPARAGEPYLLDPEAFGAPVYPRTRGGTSLPA